MEKIKNFINADFLETEQTSKVINPSTEEVITHAPLSTMMDGINSISSAKKAFERWREKTSQEKKEIFSNFVQIIKEKKDVLILEEIRNSGKTYSITKKEIEDSIKIFEFYENYLTLQSDTEFKEEIIRKPLGLCVAYTSCDQPFYSLAKFIAPALAFGNVLICKPAFETPQTAFILSNLIKGVFPKGVINFIYGDDRELVEFFTTHPAVDFISYSGSSKNGSKILKNSPEQFKKIHLNLEVKNSSIIFKDANISDLIDVHIKACFSNQGQSSMNISRIFIQEQVYDEFKEQFKIAMSKIKIGPNNEDDFGPLINQKRLESFEKAVSDALKEKGKIIFGKENVNLPKQGFFVAPTLIEDLSDCSPLQQEEVKGPFVTLRKFKYPKEAIKWVNTTPYGAAASVWTADLERFYKVASQLDLGTLWYNDWGRLEPQEYLNAFKESGFGHTLYVADLFTKSTKVIF